MNYNRVTIAENKTPLLVICGDKEGNFLQVPEAFASMFGLDVQIASFEVHNGSLYVCSITDDAECVFACGEYPYRKEAEVTKTNEIAILREVLNFATDEALCPAAIRALAGALLASGEEIHLAIKHRARL